MTDLRKIPGVGKNMEQHLLALGIDSFASLRGKDPEALYRRDCETHDGYADPCVLYVYRLAVYFAETERPDPEKCRWWYWKGRPYPEKKERIL